jgi:hypothetical protein
MRLDDDYDITPRTNKRDLIMTVGLAAFLVWVMFL